MAASSLDDLAQARQIEELKAELTKAQAQREAGAASRRPAGFIAGTRRDS